MTPSSLRSRCVLLSLWGCSGVTFWTTVTTDCSRPVFCRGDWVGVATRGFGWVWCSLFLDDCLKLVYDPYVAFNCAWNLRQKSPWGMRLPGCLPRGLPMPLGTSSLAWGHCGMVPVTVSFLRMLQPRPSAFSCCPGVWWHSTSSPGSLNCMFHTSWDCSAWSRAWAAFRINPAW